LRSDRNLAFQVFQAQFLAAWRSDWTRKSMSGSMQDKRVDQRIAFIAAVEVTEIATGTRLSARTSDLSRSGCYIDTLNPTPSKTVVRVRISHNNEELELPGRIVYVSPGLGMGVRFDDQLSTQQTYVLARWLSNAK
jgi:hypothetical protein